jgi:hypothetical protein
VTVTDADTVTADDLVECLAVPHEIELNPINMLILLDRSASMSLSQFNGETYETVIDRALTELVTSPDNSLVNFGLSVFPARECRQGNGRNREFRAVALHPARPRRLPAF